MTTGKYNLTIEPVCGNLIIGLGSVVLDRRRLMVSQMPADLLH